MKATFPDIVIREVKPNDAASLAVYMRALCLEALDTISSRPPPTLEEERDFIAKAAEAGGAIFVGVQASAIIGLLDLWPGQKPHDRHVCRLGMSVARERRGQGIGRKLLEAAVDRCRSWPSACRLELEVVPWNTPALSLYQQLGFVIEATKRKAINLRGEPEDLVLMALTW
jgi:RimJ/RimL family protein N-acetyltransferase